MAIIQKLDKWDLQREFKAYDRDYYSLDGYQAMIDIFEDLGEDWELDVIALCCDFNEATPEEIANDYGLNTNYNNWENDVLQYLNENTLAVELDDTILYQNF